MDGTVMFGPKLRGVSAAAIELALHAAAGGAAAVLVWSIATPHGPIGAAPMFTDDAPARARLSAFATLNDPFATAGQASAVTARLLSNDIVLHATRVGAMDSGTAIVSVSGGPHIVVHSGDEIVPGAILAQVAYDHIEIERGGHRERIRFPLHAFPGSTVVDDVADIAAESETIALAELGLRPATRGGKTIGYELLAEEAYRLGGLGVEAGDILISVNGQSLTPSTLAAHRASLLAGAPASITLERAGARKTLQLGSAFP